MAGEQLTNSYRNRPDILAEYDPKSQSWKCKACDFTLSQRDFPFVSDLLRWRRFKKHYNSPPEVSTFSANHLEGLCPMRLAVFPNLCRLTFLDVVWRRMANAAIATPKMARTAIVIGIV